MTEDRRLRELSRDAAYMRRLYEAGELRQEDWLAYLESAAARRSGILSDLARRGEIDGEWPSR